MQANAGKLRGGIAMTSPVQDYFIRADRLPASGDLENRPPARRAGDAGRRPRRRAQAGRRRRHTRTQHRRARHDLRHRTRCRCECDPVVVLVSEHYNLIARLLQRGIPVKLAVNVQAAFDDSDRMTANVIAEIQAPIRPSAARS